MQAFGFNAALNAQNKQDIAAKAARDGKRKIVAGASEKKSEIDMLARSDWLRATKKGRAPEEMIVDINREIKDTLHRIEKNTGGLE